MNRSTRVNYFEATRIIHHFLYLWFLPKQPELVLGSAHGVFWIRPWPRCTVSLSVVSFGRVADGTIWARSAQILTEVLEGEVSRRFEARFEWLHNYCWILGSEEENKFSYLYPNTNPTSRLLPAYRFHRFLKMLAITALFPFFLHLPFARLQPWQLKPFPLDIWRWWE